MNSNKTVAVVGVIGIGSLALLEVQNRLKNRDSTAANEPLEHDDSQTVSTTGDQTINGMMSDSDFDKFLNGDPSETEAAAAPGQQMTFELKPASDGGTDMTWMFHTRHTSPVRRMVARLVFSPILRRQAIQAMTNLTGLLDRQPD